MYRTVKNINELMTLSLGEGNVVRTLGYYEIGDGGGAEYIIQKTSLAVDMGSVIPVPGEFQAHLIVQDRVYYKVFGTKNNGIFDDGIAIKKAHAFANAKKLPIINPSGEYWIKDTYDIEIQTGVDWGMSVFHIDEAFNRTDASRFLVSGEKPAIELERSRQMQLLPYLRKGQYIIPELKEFANHIVIVRDDHCRVGHRSGDIQKSWAMEDFFYVEEHGRILGEITWDFGDITHLELIPCDPNYLVIQGGSFFLTGNNSGDGGQYKWAGFQIMRSRTTIRNQYVGLEPGCSDISMDPRKGFYGIYKCADITLENIRMIPSECRRGGSLNVPHGTYGIHGERVLNLLLKNVIAEGSHIHWGVVGTNLIKNFRVESCRINRIDVHFHCHNLYVRDSTIGLKGITVTGGGDLFVENTTVYGNTFIQLRRDYGSRWDGDIRIRNCKLRVAETEDHKSILSFDHEDKYYGYDIVYSRTIKIEDFIIDYTSEPSDDSDMRLVYHPSLDTAGGRTIQFPLSMKFKDILVSGRNKGLKWEEYPYLESLCKVTFENVDLD
ncbi:MULTISPECIES: hypothetical protein [unclassified Paenibacillus]|uniref:hypothetical protein n=1 Tax=unclassified Paenibacillus TaxID=185978 RepID=UPI002F42FBF5